MTTFDVPPATTLPTRAAALRPLFDEIVASGARRWAVQGDEGALGRWTAADDTHDLDLWVAAADHEHVVGALEAVGAVRARSTSLIGRLRHEQWWLAGAGRSALVDVTVGDLRVGPLLLLPDSEIAVDSFARDPNGVATLSGAARALDLALRPLLRGRLVAGDRLVEARAAWATMDHETTTTTRVLLRGSLGSPLAGCVEAWLGGAHAPSHLVHAARRRLILASLRPRSLRSTWCDRRSILPTRHRSPLGLRQRGVVVAIVGADGSGKSTVAVELAAQLRDAGYRVDHVHFGMARANVPGLGLLRRLMRGGDPEAGSTGLHLAVEERTPRGALVGRADTWVSAAGYCWRALTRLWPARRGRRVVICDRWVSDLRGNRWPGSRAATVAEWLIGRPDVFAVADAPVETIEAREADRTPTEIVAEQAALRALAADLDGRRGRGRECRTLVVPTNRPIAASAAPLVAAVVAAAHA